MEATDIIEICEYILKQRELAVEKTNQKTGYLNTCDT